MPALKNDGSWDRVPLKYGFLQLQVNCFYADLQLGSPSAPPQPTVAHSNLTDSAVVGYMSGGQQEEDTALVSDFVDWSGKNHLLLNVAKTRRTSEGRQRPHSP